VLDAIDDLPENDEIGVREPQRAILMFRSGDTPPPMPVLRPVPSPEPAVVDDPVVDDAAAPNGADETAELDDAAVEPNEATAELIAEHTLEGPDDQDHQLDIEDEDMGKARPSRKLVWIAAGFALLSVAQTAIIANLVMKDPGSAPQAVAAAPIPDSPVVADVVPELPVTTGSDVATSASAGAPGGLAAARPQPLAPAVPAAEEAASAPPLGGRFGGVRISAPIDLQVFQDGALVGSTAGPIALAEGAHSLYLVNESLAYRSRQTVTVRAGQLTPLRVALPQGRVNINATPWANVWIDGNAAGETPIANLTLPIGTHEIVFRHPQLGEQRATATVKAEGVARISASFQR
jgi:hypothetical protein